MARPASATCLKRLRPVPGSVRAFSKITNASCHLSICTCFRVGLHGAKDTQAAVCARMLMRRGCHAAVAISEQRCPHACSMQCTCQRSKMIPSGTWAL
eukprot:365535-Chlamydomonas_euryale.AAC.19